MKKNLDVWTGCRWTCFYLTQRYPINNYTHFTDKKKKGKYQKQKQKTG